MGNENEGYLARATEDEDDVEGHRMRQAREGIGPDLRATEDEDDVEGHRLKGARNTGE